MMEIYAEYYHIASNTVWSMNEQLTPEELEVFQASSTHELEEAGFTFQRIPQPLADITDELS